MLICLPLTNHDIMFAKTEFNNCFIIPSLNLLCTITFRNREAGVTLPSTIRWSSSNSLSFRYTTVPKCIIPLLGHFTKLGQKNAQNVPRYYTVEQSKNTD